MEPATSSTEGLYTTQTIPLRRRSLNKNSEENLSAFTNNPHVPILQELMSTIRATRYVLTYCYLLLLSFL